MSKTTALNPIHQASKAKFINFSGYNMPVWYSSIKQEHLAVRQQAGMFDVSHMGLFSLSGPGADAFIERLSCNHIKNAQKQKMIYSMFLNESGMILDDVMFGKYNDKWHLVVNCSNCEK